MSDWEPGIPLYAWPDDPGFNGSVYAVRPIFQLITAALPFNVKRAARWPEPYDIHDLDVQEGAL